MLSDLISSSGYDPIVVDMTSSISYLAETEYICVIAFPLVRLLFCEVEYDIIIFDRKSLLCL